MKFEMVDGLRQGPTLKVIGVGGGGGNAVEYMVAKEIEGVEFIAANTDNQALESLTAVPTRVILGKEVTRGYGAGGDPDLGRAAAEENRNDIRDAIQGTDMLFVAAGMGGGTGTGAAPVVAEVARELGVLTVAVVTRPFGRERRTETADAGIIELSRHVDTMITIPNDKLSQLTGESTGFMDVFEKPNQVLLGAVQGIADVITRVGRINVDFADVKTVMSKRGAALMGTGRAGGEGRAAEAVDQAVRSPLLEDVDLKGAKAVLVNLTGGPDLQYDEFEDVQEAVTGHTDPDVRVFAGVVIDPDLQDEIRVTVVATGIPNRAMQPGIVVNNAPVTAAVEPHNFERPAYERERQNEPRPPLVAQREGTTGGGERLLSLHEFFTRQAD